MDYRRIQLILIVTFSVLNIYLISVLLEKNDAMNFGDPSTTVRLEEGMTNDNIVAPVLSDEEPSIPIIKADRSDYLSENMSQLSNQTTRMEDGTLLSTLTNLIELDMDADTSLETRLAPLEKFVRSENVLLAEEYTYLTYQAENRRIIYTQRAGGYPIADGTGSLVFHLNSEGNVLSYEQTYIGEAEVQGKERTVVSEQRAIETLYLNNEIPSNSTLRAVELTYYQTLSLSDMTIYSPMWYVEIAREKVPVQVKHVDALTGNIVSAPSLSNPGNGADPGDSSSDENQSLEDSAEMLMENQEALLESTIESEEDEVLFNSDGGRVLITE